MFWNNLQALQSLYFCFYPNSLLAIPLVLMCKQLGGLKFTLKLVLHIPAIFHCNPPHKPQFHSALSQSPSRQWFYAPVLLLKIPSSIHSRINLVRVCLKDTLKTCQSFRTAFFCSLALTKQLYISMDIVFCHKFTHIKVGQSAYFTFFLFFL